MSNPAFWLAFLLLTPLLSFVLLTELKGGEARKTIEKNEIQNELESCYNEK